jgi:cyclopropane fatty-acyl-phospholipid synthase-like methyltransferase
VSHGGVERRFRHEASRWDQIYTDRGHPLARAWDRWTRSNVRRRFERTFEIAGDLAGATGLDLGCGTGRYLVEALDRGAARVVGVDFAPEMIEQAQRLVDDRGSGDRVNLRCEDLASVAIDGRFDLVIENGVFDYLAEALPALSRARAWTRGCFVATFPDRRAPRAAPRALYWRLRGIHIRFFDRRSIAALAEEAGFRDVAIEKIGPIYLLTARG